MVIETTRKCMEKKRQFIASPPIEKDKKNVCRDLLVPGNIQGSFPADYGRTRPGAELANKCYPGHFLCSD